MAETEVSNEVPKVVEVEEKCSSEMSSCKDLPKPDCNGTADLDNSYVFVTGDDGLPDDTVGDKDAVGEGLNILPESEAVAVEDHGEKLDPEIEKLDPEIEKLDPESEQLDPESEKLDPENVKLDPENEKLDPESEKLDTGSREVSKHLNETENGNVELSNGDLTVVNDSVEDPENEKVDAVSREASEPLNERENGNVVLSNGDLTVVNDSVEDNTGENEIVVEAEVKMVNDPDGTIAEVVVDQNGETKDVAADEQKKLDDPMESDPSSDPVENQESQIRALELVKESGEIGELENTSSLVDGSVSAEDGLQDQINLSTIGTLKAYQGSEGVVVNVVGSDLQDVGTEDKDEVKLEREMVNALEDEVPTSTSLDLDPSPINDKEETLVKESRENGEVDINSSKTSDSGNANDGSEDQINLSVTEESDASQGSKDVVANRAACEVQDVSMDAKDELKLEKEAAETAEIEVPKATSLDLDLELNQKNEKEETLDQEPREKGELDILSPNINNFGNANGKSEGQINLSVTDTSGEDVAAGTLQDVENEKEETLGQEPREKGELDIISPNINNFGNANGESEGQINLSVTDTSGEDVAAGALQDVGMEAENDVKLEKEAAETVEHEASPSTSLDLNKKEETLKEESAEIGELDIISSSINNSGKATDECEDQVNLSVTEAFEESQGSEDVAVNVADRDLQEVNMETKDEIKLEREGVETGEHGVLASTSSELELESHPINKTEEKVEEEATTTFSSAVPQSQQCDTAPEKNVPAVLEQIDEAKTVPINTDCHVETVGDLVLDEPSKEDLSDSHVDNGVQYPEVPDKHLDGSGVSSETSQSENKTEASLPTQSFPTSNDYEPEIENEISDAETVGAVSFSHVDGPKPEVVEEALPAHDSSIMSNINEARSGSDSTVETVVLTEKESTSREVETHAETEVLSEKAEAGDSPPETFDVKLEPGDHIHEVSDNVDVKKDAANIVSEIRDVEDMVDELDGAAGISNENLSLQENEDTENSSSNNVSEASLGGSLINGEAAIIKTKPTPFNFLVKVPRFDDESLREQIRLAKLHVDEKTRLREAVQVQIQEKRAHTQVHGIDYEYAKGEARSARKLVRSKRVEIDSLQTVINKAKNALSIEDIDSQIYNMEHMIQHETLPLKEEKQLIREIKQLKQLREQLSSNMGSQDEVKQALEQREEVEERLKILRKELDVLKGRVLKAEAVAAEAEKKYDDENKKVRELQTQFRAADDVRQAAYFHWQNLRKELSEKTKHFFKYKDNAALANNYTFTRDTEALYRLCSHNVENFMQLWNTSQEFRADYVKFNFRSYVRRFGTSDGRTLGPDEEPLALPSYVNDRATKMVPTPVKIDNEPTSQAPIEELKQEEEPTVGNVVSQDKTVKKLMENDKNKKVTNKEPTLHISSNGLDIISVRDIANEVQEEPKKTKDEIESIRKAEEMRKEEIEAKLKEERRLEALAKANEARERKKRQAEKLQMRAELKTQKEAEQKEKEREKRQRKKERKKAATDVNDIETAPSSETASVISNETEVKDTTSSSSSSTAAPAAVTKKPQKSWLFGKQSKTKSALPPAAIRNRNKKRLHQWIWVGVTSLVILILFWLGNIGVFSSVHYKRRNPVL